jgi:hypothetical protein
MACPMLLEVGVRPRNFEGSQRSLIGPDFRAYFAGTAYRGF